MLVRLGEDMPVQDVENPKTTKAMADEKKPNALPEYSHRRKQPNPFKWREKISNQFIERAIDEGRE